MGCALVNLLRGDKGQHVVNGYDDTSRLIFTHLPEGETRTAIMQLRSTDPNIKGSIPDLGITLDNLLSEMP